MSLLDAMRLLDRAQRGKRVRLITWEQVREAIDRVAAGTKFVGVDGGAIEGPTDFPAKTTLVIIARNKQNHIIMGCARVPVIDVKREGSFLIFNQAQLNRGPWYRVTGFDIDKWMWTPLDSNQCYVQD